MCVPVQLGENVRKCKFSFLCVLSYTVQKCTLIAKNSGIIIWTKTKDTNSNGMAAGEWGSPKNFDEHFERYQDWGYNVNTSHYAVFFSFVLSSFRCLLQSVLLHWSFCAFCWSNSFAHTFPTLWRRFIQMIFICIWNSWIEPLFIDISISNITILTLPYVTRDRDHTTKSKMYISNWHRI